MSRAAWAAALTIVALGVVGSAGAVAARGTGARHPALAPPIPMYADNLVAHAGFVWFRGYDSGTNTTGLWKTDGTASGTSEVEHDVDPNRLKWVGSKLFFTGYDSTAGNELWVTNGTPGNAHRIGDMVPGDIEVEDEIAFGTRLVYTACDDQHGCEPWISNGTPVGTHRLRDIIPGVDGSDPGGYGVIGNRVLFCATDRAHGEELWRTNGTPEGTVLVKDIFPGPYNSDPCGMVRIGTVLQFWADDNVHGEEPWVSDGTTQGTHLLRDIAPGTSDASSGEPVPGVPFGQRWWLSANDGVHGGEAWTTDGTKKGTQLGIDVVHGPASSRAYGFKANGPTMFFSARDQHGYELWATNAQRTNVRLVKDIWPGGQSSNPNPNYSGRLTGGRIVFLADDGIHGQEPWVSNGSAAGTHLLRNIIPGSGDAYFYSFASLGGVMVMSMNDGYLWVTDGHPGAGHTDLVANIP